jgi:methylase of polypeptide subunit release factors
MRRRREEHPKLFDVWTEETIAAIGLDLGSWTVKGENKKPHPKVWPLDLHELEWRVNVRNGILNGEDPLGDALCLVRSPESRREKGAVYTPSTIVQAMVDWAAQNGDPSQVVDPGCGSARFLLAAAKAFPNATLHGIEIDALSTLVARANLAVRGLAGRAFVHQCDFRSWTLPETSGPTLFIGNPPYVRHHNISASWKKWLVRNASQLGLKASQLAGLHAHFYLATALKARPGDYGAFITSAEWLDVNYGSLMRELFLRHLGGTGLVVIDPTAEPFPGTAVTGAVSYFEVGEKPKRIMLTKVKTLSDLQSKTATRGIRRERLEAEKRWSHFTRQSRKPPEGFVELGELCRVHRGAVTGANRIWIAGDHSGAIPDRFLVPTVTRGREILDAGEELKSAKVLKCVIDLPEDLGELDQEERTIVKRFLSYAKKQGAHEGYIAQTRRAWWSVGLRTAAPMLATYMARRAPGFVLNSAKARHLNIAHGLYPREQMNRKAMSSLVRYLSGNTSVALGRTYAGGLTKFEPREMERVLVPSLELLTAR